MAKLLAVAAFLLLIVGGVAVKAHTENMVSTLATYEEAEEASAVHRGWIPAFVPRSAGEIREVHNVDTNRQWLRFTVDEVEAQQMVSSLQPLTLDKARPSSSRPPRWTGAWPEELGGGRRTSRTELSLHYDPRPGLGARCVAVEWLTPATVYAWRC